MRNDELTINDFFDDYRDAIDYGYNPSIMDCISYMASLVTFEQNKNMLSNFIDLFDESIKDLPRELSFFVAVWSIYLLIPFGGFVVMGLLMYFMDCSPKKLKLRRKRHVKRWNEGNENY